MRLLMKMVSAFLAACMVISMVPLATLATETDTAQSVEGRILLDPSCDQASAWIDGVGYAVRSDGENNYIDLPADAEPGSMVTYTYHVGDVDDVHTQYPVGMQVWELKKNADGSYTPEKIEALNNILQYSGISIRITGKKGIRMITSIERNKKSNLISGGLGGYKLLEYGTVLAWASNLEGGNPLILGQDYAKSNYAYKKGVADPVFAYSGNLMQYTNVLVDFTMDECKDDIAMRAYMILESPDGEQITIYGGTVQRSIGYIAWQNRNTFKPGSAAYEYVWEIIRHVYGDVCEVSFESNGGSAVEPIVTQRGSAIEKPTDPVKDGYTFAGWYQDRKLTKRFNFTTAISDSLTLFGKWETVNTGKPTMPENPSEADEYYFSNSEVLEVRNAADSNNLLTETLAKTLLEDRGFIDYPAFYEYTSDGSYVGETEISETVDKHPMYLTYYISSSNEVWTIYIIDGEIYANPASFNLESNSNVLMLVSETAKITSYDDASNQFYVTIPYSSSMIVKIVKRIDSETLDGLTAEVLSK